MNLQQVNEGDIIQIIELKIPRRTIKRFNSINFNVGRIFFVDEVVKEKFIKLIFYNKKETKENIKKYNINNEGRSLIISKYYFDKIEVKILKKDEEIEKRNQNGT